MSASKKTIGFRTKESGAGDSGKSAHTKVSSPKVATPIRQRNQQPVTNSTENLSKTATHSNGPNSSASPGSTGKALPDKGGGRSPPWHALPDNAHYSAYRVIATHSPPPPPFNSGDGNDEPRDDSDSDDDGGETDSTTLQSTSEEEDDDKPPDNCVDQPSPSRSVQIESVAYDQLNTSATHTNNGSDVSARVDGNQTQLFQNANPKAATPTGGVRETSTSTNKIIVPIKSARSECSASTMQPCSKQSAASHRFSGRNRRRRILPGKNDSTCKTSEGGGDAGRVTLGFGDGYRTKNQPLATRTQATGAGDAGIAAETNAETKRIRRERIPLHTIHESTAVLPENRAKLVQSRLSISPASKSNWRDRCDNEEFEHGPVKRPFNVKQPRYDVGRIASVQTEDVCKTDVAQSDLQKELYEKYHIGWVEASLTTTRKGRIACKMPSTTDVQQLDSITDNSKTAPKKFRILTQQFSQEQLEVSYLNQQLLLDNKASRINDDLTNADETAARHFSVLLRRAQLVRFRVRARAGPTTADPHADVVNSRGDNPHLHKPVTVDDNQGCETAASQNVNVNIDDLKTPTNADDPATIGRQKLPALSKLWKSNEIYDVVPLRVAQPALYESLLPTTIAASEQPHVPEKLPLNSQRLPGIIIRVSQRQRNGFIFCPSVSEPVSFSFDYVLNCCIEPECGDNVEFSLACQSLAQVANASTLLSPLGKAAASTFVAGNIAVLPHRTLLPDIFLDQRKFSGGRIAELPSGDGSRPGWIEYYCWRRTNGCDANETVEMSHNAALDVGPRIYFTRASTLFDHSSLVQVGNQVKFRVIHGIGQVSEANSARQTYKEIGDACGLCKQAANLSDRALINLQQQSHAPPDKSTTKTCWPAFATSIQIIGGMSPNRYGIVSYLKPSHNFGFVEVDGIEDAWFHRMRMQNPSEYDELKVGDVVELAILECSADDDDGLQAINVGKIGSAIDSAVRISVPYSSILATVPRLIGTIVQEIGSIGSRKSVYHGIVETQFEAVNINEKRYDHDTIMSAVRSAIENQRVCVSRQASCAYEHIDGLNEDDSGCVKFALATQCNYGEHFRIGDEVAFRMAVAANGTLWAAGVDRLRHQLQVLSAPALPRKRYGFLSYKGQELFFHSSEVTAKEGSYFKLKSGDKVSCVITHDPRGRLRATLVTKI